MKQEDATMRDCARFERHFENLLAGHLAAEDRDDLAVHVAECAGCCELYDLHAQLADAELDEPRDEDLARMRAHVLQHLQGQPVQGQPVQGQPVQGQANAKVLTFAERSPAAERSTGAAPRFRSSAWAALAAAAVLAVGLGGFLAGRHGVGTAIDLGSESGLLLSDLEQMAQHNRTLADTESSPYLFSNVRLRPNDDGAVRLSFEVSTHMEVQRPAEDPLVRELLVQSLLDPSSVGNRLDALELAPGRLGGMEPKVRQALVHTVLRDANLAVRLRAVSILAQQPADPELVAAFVEVLESDESVQMRLLAIDYLGASGMSADTLQETIFESQSESAMPALLVRAGQQIDS